MFTVYEEASDQPPDALGRKTYSLITKEYSYPEERATLKALCQKIAARVPEAFPDDDAVFELFAKSLFTGDLLRLGRVIDNSFGKGTFRRLAEAPNAEGLRDVVNSL